MEKYEITKEQILEMASWGNPYNLEQVQEWFPEAFNTELEVGKWYKGTKTFFLVNYQSDNMENYGFWEDQRFRNDLSFGSFWSNQCVEATPQEVETALINYLEKQIN